MIKRFLQPALFLFFALAMIPFPADAKLLSKEIVYRDNDLRLRGYYVYDGATEGKRPGILLVHEWWGHNDYARYRADELAKLGYAVFALDMYGEGQVTDNPGEAQAWSKPFYDDRKLMVERAKAGLSVLLQQEEVLEGANHIAVVGYCFGGTVGLEMARKQLDIAAVVSFHGGLQTPNPANETGQIKPSLLVLNGADDPMVPTAERNAFIAEMQKVKADFQFVEYANAVHAFTNPKADQFNIPGVGYNEKADKRSWKLLEDFLSSSLKSDQ